MPDGAQRIATIGNAKAKNVILFIGDGMGDSEIIVARNYLHGVNGTFQGLDKIGQPGALQTSTGKAAESGVGQYTTFSLGGSSNDSLMAKDSKGQLTGSKTAGVITPVTDSSASGSGWATGTKTYNNAVSVDVKGNPQLNLIELAKANGLATGNVTTSEIQDATPAVQESHSSERACYGPQGKWDGTDKNGDGKVDIKDAELAGIGRCLADQLKANGGIGSISEQLLDTRADVTIGGGAKYFNQLDENGNTLWQQAADRGFQTVKSGDVDGFKNLTYKDGQPVLALLGDDQVAQGVEFRRIIVQILDISRGLAIPQRPPELAQIDGVEGNAERFPELGFVTAVEIVVPPVHVHHREPVPAQREPLTPPSRAHGQLRGVPAHECGDDIAFVIMAEMDRRLLVAIHYAVGLPVVHGGARGELDMQRIGHDFNVLASREPTGRLCPALSEREREIQQIVRPCRNASTQASHGWRATRRSGGGPRLRKGSACHGRHNDRHPL